MAPLANNEDLQLDMSQTIFTALISLGFNPTTIEQKERLPINEVSDVDTCIWKSYN